MPHLLELNASNNELTTYFLFKPPKNLKVRCKKMHFIGLNSKLFSKSNLDIIFGHVQKWIFMPSLFFFLTSSAILAAFPNVWVFYAARFSLLCSFTPWTLVCHGKVCCSSQNFCLPCRIHQTFSGIISCLSNYELVWNTYLKCSCVLVFPLLLFSCSPLWVTKSRRLFWNVTFMYLSVFSVNLFNMYA